MYGKRKHSSYRGKGRKRARLSNWKSSNSGFTSTQYRGPKSRSVPYVANFSRALTNQPDVLRIKVTTYLASGWTSTTGAVVAANIKCNSLHLPFNSISSSHENPTISNLAPLYQKYKVLSASLVTRWYPLDDAKGAMGGWAAVSVGDNNVNPWNWNTPNMYMESGRGFGTYLPTFSACKGAVTLRRFIDCAALVGQTRQGYLGDNSYEGTITSASVRTDPSTLTNFCIMYQSSDATTTTKHAADIILTQYVMLYSRCSYA